MPYNTIFTKTESATASCAVGTGADTYAVVSSQSIISQRDVDRKGLGWAQALATSRLRCAVSRFYGALNPLAAITYSGPVGGGFSSAYSKFVLTNVGNDALSWTASPVDSWVTIDVASGFLYAGESVIVTVSLTAAVNSFGPGDYVGSVLFTNVNTEAITLGAVNLEAILDPLISSSYISAGGTAALCGYSEYGVASSPPKKYTVQTTAGTVYKGTFSTGDCSIVPMTGGTWTDVASTAGWACPTCVALSLGAVFSYDPVTDIATLVLTKEGGREEDAYHSFWVWGVEFGITAGGDGITYGTLINAGTAISWVGDVASGVGAGNGLKVFTATWTVGAAPYIRVVYNGRNGGTGAALAFPSDPQYTFLGTPASLLRDELDIVETYDPAAACALGTVDNSNRYSGSGVFPLSAGGVLDNPADTADYAAWLSTVETSTTLTTVSASGSCEVDGGGTAKATGGYTLTLSAEDTDAAAIARAILTSGVSGVANYENRAAGFTFEYHTVDSITLDFTDVWAGTSYTATIDLVEEDFGGGNAATTQRTYSFTASAGTHQIVDSSPVVAPIGKQITVGNPQVTTV